MTIFWVLDVACLAVILVAAVLVVRLERLSGAVMALSALGTVMTLLFVVLHAPDVAHSEVVVGAVALPVLYLIALGKIRREITGPEARRRLGLEDEGDRPAGATTGRGPGFLSGPPR